MEQEGRTINPGLYVIVSLLFLTSSVVYGGLRFGMGIHGGSAMVLLLAAISGVVSSALFVHYMLNEAFRSGAFMLGTLLAWLAATFLAFVHIAYHAGIL